MQSGIYCYEEKKEIDIFFGGKIGVGTEKGILRENGEEHEAYSLFLNELKENHDVGADLRDKPIEVLPFKIRLIFQEGNVNSVNILIKYLESIKEELKKLCTTK